MDLLKIAKQPFVVGTKQVLRAVHQGEVERVLVGADAEERVIRDVLAACKEKNLEVDHSYTREELGAACKLKVGAAAVAVLKSIR